MPPAPAVILGDLNLLRCFADTDLRAVVATSDAENPTLHSRYCAQSKMIASPQKNPARAAEDLIDLAKTFTAKPALFYGNDANLLLVSRHRDELLPHYHFRLPPADLIEDLVIKTRFAALATKHDLPVPKSFLSTDFASSHAALQQLTLPVILKPNSRVGWLESDVIKSEGGKPQKVLRADSPDQFHQAWSAISRFSPDFILQQYIPGGDDCIYSFHAYYDANSNCLAHYVGRKIRTYPKDSGVSTYVELVKEPRVVALGKEILAKLNFTGVAKIDFKLDGRTNRFYLLEINPRFNLWNRLAAACGINLATICYNDLLEVPQQLPHDYRAGVRWLSLIDDARSFIRDYHPDGLSWTKYLASFRGPKVYDVFSWRDPVPFIVDNSRYLRSFVRNRVSKFASLRRHFGHPREPRSPECCPLED